MRYQVCLADLTEEEQEEATRLEPRRVCGEFHRYFSVETGVPVYKPWFCKDYHHCEKCRARKEEELKKRVLPLINQDAKVLTRPETDRAKLVKKYGKENCLFIPHNDQVICVIKTSQNIGEPLTNELAYEICAHAVPPKGKRISGNLGKKASSGPPDIVEEEKLPVKRRVFKVTDKNDKPATQEQVDEIQKQVYEETKELDPHTADEAQWCVYVLEEKTRELAERRGLYVLFLYTETINVLESKIDWSHRAEIVFSS